jgi:hypothetical protein
MPDDRPQADHEGNRRPSLDMTEPRGSPREELDELAGLLGVASEHTGATALTRGVVRMKQSVQASSSDRQPTAI